MNQNELQQSLVLIKPDALKNSLSGYILSQLSEYHTGLGIAGAKIVNVSKMLAEEHYAEHKGKGFFPSLLEYISGALHFPGNPSQQRVEAFVFEGSDAIKKIREICGPTNPHNAREEKPGCIRSLGSIIPLKDASGNITGDRMDNLIHASANPADAEREVKLWFKPADIPSVKRIFATEMCTEYIFYKEGKISSTYSNGSSCVMAPGDLVWKSDLDALKAIAKGQQSAVTVESVAAKYLINL